MSVQTTIQAAIKAGFTGDSLTTAVAIAGAESGYHENAIGDEALQTSKWGPSIGLWQIRSLKKDYLYLDKNRDAEKLKDATANAKAAFIISSGGKDFTPWSTFVYQKHLNWIEDAKTGIAEFNAKPPQKEITIVALSILVLLFTIKYFL